MYNGVVYRNMNECLYHKAIPHSSSVKKQNKKNCLRKLWTTNFKIAIFFNICLLDKVLKRFFVVEVFTHPEPWDCSIGF